MQPSAVGDRVGNHLSHRMHRRAVIAAVLVHRPSYDKHLLLIHRSSQLRWFPLAQSNLLEN
jgi:hypothetical protein